MTDQSPSQRGVTRRRFLIGAAAAGGIASVGGIGYAFAPDTLKSRLGLGPEPFVPDAPEGQVRLESVMSQARGQQVDLFTAVPAGYGDGAGLPVVVILHGASATAADYHEYGLGRFLTQAVRDGAEPFVLAGADGGVLRWEKDPTSNDDPQRMVVEEIPTWVADRGYDATRRALWGWSMGGYGTLNIAESHPSWALAAAAFSPAMSDGDAVFDNVDALGDLPLGVWCGTEDPYYQPTQQFVAGLASPPEIASYSHGVHGRVYWNDHTLEAFSFLAQHLAASG